MRRLLSTAIIASLVACSAHVSTALASIPLRPSAPLIREVNETLGEKVYAEYDIPADKSKRCPKFEPMLREAGLQPVAVFSYIAWRESGCNPNAVNARWDSAGNLVWTRNRNGSIDRGLLQINSCWRSLVRDTCGTGLDGLYDLPCHLKVAKRIFTETRGGLANWNIQPTN